MVARRNAVAHPSRIVVQGGIPPGLADEIKLNSDSFLGLKVPLIYRVVYPVAGFPVGKKFGKFNVAPVKDIYRLVVEVKVFRKVVAQVIAAFVRGGTRIFGVVSDV